MGGGGVFIQIFMFCPTSFFSNQIQMNQHSSKNQFCCTKYHCLMRVFGTFKYKNIVRNTWLDFILMSITRTLIGVCILIYSCFARQISFQIDEFKFWVWKETCLAGHECMSIHPFHAINVSVMALCSTKMNRQNC